MRKDRLYVLGTLVLVFWISVTYFLYFHRPQTPVPQGSRSPGSSGSSEHGAESLRKKIDDFEQRLKLQQEENQKILHDLEVLRNGPATAEKSKATEGKRNKEEAFKDFGEYAGKDLETLDDPAIVEGSPNESVGAGEEGVVKDSDKIAVLMFACNRPNVSRALDSLLKHRKDPHQFPVIVSQDCGHQETRRVLESYSPNITLLFQPDQSEPEVPPKEKKFKGYFKISRHYGWALGQVFGPLGFRQAVVVEDDLEFAPDFFSYFSATLPVLRSDPSLFCVSAWNDNGKEALIDESRPDLLYRTDFFGGLGWMLTAEMWEELKPKWPKAYWDDWIREPAQRKGRACIRPEISRTKTFGKVGVSNGMFFDKHLRYIKLSDANVDFSSMDLSFLRKEIYDKVMDSMLNDVPVVTYDDVKFGKAKSSHAQVRLLYHTKVAFKKATKMLGIMDDFRSGVPRMAYRGVVPTMHDGLRVFLAPNLNWKGYDPTW